MERKSSGASPAVSTAEHVASDEAVRHALERVSSSKAFSQSDSLKRFIQYIVEARLEGKEGELKEFTIGAEVFERGESYDPRIDPIVRVQATRLRSKLRDYYQDEGSSDALVIELPKGAYVPSFRPREASSSESTTRDGSRGVSLPRSLGWVAALAAAAVVVIFAVTNRGTDNVAGGDVRSLVVLPFTDMSVAQDQQYYGDGLADEITSTLAEVRDLDVVPRMTAFAFRDRDLVTVQEALHVDAALQGSVRKSEDTLRVTAQLIRLADGRQIWSESFERTQDHAFEVQDVIARAVAVAVEKELMAERGASAAHVPEPAAYEDYLKARFELSQTTRVSVGRSIRLFERATEIDPGYAKAYAGLVQAYVVNVLWGFAPPDETREPAREAAEQALSLDAGQAEALSAAAAFQLIYEWDLDAARKLLESADPDNDEMHAVQGLLLIAEGRLDEALAELERAIELAPDTPFLHHLAATAVYYAGDYATSLQMSEAVMTWAPDYALTPLLVSQIYMRQGELLAAGAALDTFQRMAGDTTLALSARAILEAHSGREPEAKALLERLRTRTSYVPAAFVARVLVALGERDAALAELETARLERSLPILTLRSDPAFALLTDEPRFTALLDAVGLAD